MPDQKSEATGDSDANNLYEKQVLKDLKVQETKVIPDSVKNKKQEKVFYFFFPS